MILVDRGLCRLWATATEQARRNGRPILAPDAWIAATAVPLGVPLLTNNRDAFAGGDNLRFLPEPES